MIGFFVVLITSARSNSLRFHPTVRRWCLEPGGLIGMELAQFVRRSFGFTGGTLLLLLALLATGCRCSPGVSGWL